MSCLEDDVSIEQSLTPRTLLFSLARPRQFSLRLYDQWMCSRGLGVHCVPTDAFPSGRIITMTGQVMSVHIERAVDVFPTRRERFGRTDVPERQKVDKRISSRRQMGLVCQEHIVSHRSGGRRVMLSLSASALSIASSVCRQYAFIGLVACSVRQS